MYYHDNFSAQRHLNRVTFHCYAAVGEKHRQITPLVLVIRAGQGRMVRVADQAGQILQLDTLQRRAYR